MKLDLTTPALLFPAISLLLLAYTNRFLAIANLIRGLHTAYKNSGDKSLIWQIKNLKLRLKIIRAMQALGVSSLFLCVFCMLSLFMNWILVAQIIFSTGLVFLLVSLALSVAEIQISAKALNIQLGDLEEFR